MTATVLDIGNRHFTQAHGDITVIGTWLRNSEGNWRPCLVLIRTGDEYSDYIVPCVVSVDRAYVWSDAVGDGQRAAQMAFQFAEAMRFTPNPKIIIRIASLINDHLGELLGIPADWTQTVLFPVAYYTGDDFKPAHRLDPAQMIHWDAWGEHH